MIIYVYNQIREVKIEVEVRGLGQMFLSLASYLSTLSKFISLSLSIYQSIYQFDVKLKHVGLFQLNVSQGQE